MKNEWDLQVAVVAIAEADVGAGGIVPLHNGNAHPVKEWGDPGLGVRPITAVHIQPGRGGGGTGNTRTGVLRLIVYVGRGAQGLESQICDRYEGTPQALGIISTPALAAKGIDCRLMEPRRVDVSELTEEGGKALAIEWNYTFTRP